MIELKLFNCLDKECENNWKNFEKNSCFSFFQSFEYIKNLLAFSKNQIQIIFIYSDQELVAILPFEIKFFYSFKILQWIGNERSDYCGPLISCKFINHLDEYNFSLLWKEIKNKIDSFDLIFLNNQPSKILNLDNPFVKFLKNIKQTKIYRIDLSEDFEKYLISIKNKDKKHAYELHRVNLKYEQLKKNKQETILEVDEIINNLNNFNLIFSGKVRQLNLKKKKHLLDNIFFSLFKNLIINNSKDFYLAKFSINKELVCACLLIICNNTVYYYLPVTLINKFNKFKPGKILISAIIKWSISKKLEFFDFGIGEEDYKRHFCNTYTFVQKYLSYHSFKGRILYFAIKLMIFFGY